MHIILNFNSHLINFKTEKNFIIQLFKKSINSNSETIFLKTEGEIQKKNILLLMRINIVFNNFNFSKISVILICYLCIKNRMKNTNIMDTFIIEHTVILYTSSIVFAYIYYTVYIIYTV